MSEHLAAVAWTRTADDFAYETYPRAHTLSLGSGQALSASAAPDFKGDAALTNPEELLVGALASCHMLTFLAIASKKRLVVDAYDDAAVGVLDTNAEGRRAITRVVLRPRVRFAPGTLVDAATLERMHATAHANCFIAQSVKAAVTIEPAGAGD